MDVVEHLCLAESLFSLNVTNGQSPHGDCMYQPITLLYVWSLFPQCTCCVLRSSPIYSSSAGLFSEPVDIIARGAFCGRADGQPHTWDRPLFSAPGVYAKGMATKKRRALCFLGVCSLVLQAHSTVKCPPPCKPRVSVCSSVVSHSYNPIMRFLLQQAFSWKDRDA